MEEEEVQGGEQEEVEDESKTGLRFRKFSSIENSTHKKELQIYKEQEKLSGVWYVTEKVHGANFCAATDGKDVTAYKRTSQITEADVFFKGWQSVFEQLKPKVKRLLTLLNEDRQNKSEPLVEVVWIYGELFGGHYPGLDNLKPKGISHINNEICYAPYLSFCAFDLHDGRRYLNRDTAVSLFDRSDIFYSRTMFEGTFEQCVAFEHNFITTLPKQLGKGEWPDIQNNFAEGIVIRPKENQYLTSGSRVILKKKIDKFNEVKVPRAKKQSTKPKIEQSQEVTELQSQYKSYLNEVRLQSVVSKFGEVKVGNKGKLISLLVVDAMEELMKNSKDKWEALEKKDQKLITKLGSTEGGKVVDRYFKKHNIK